MSIKLSIIITNYNKNEYLTELLKKLEHQVTDEVQVILVDDGSKPAPKIDYEWVDYTKFKTNKGISSARNYGLNKAEGELIGIIDADDLVADYYVEMILSRFDEDFDYIDLSWKSIEKGVNDFKLSSDRDSLANPSACTRVFRKSFIGELRFNVNKDAAEDEDFTRHLRLKKAKHICITDYMYFYRTNTENSNYKTYMEGKTKTKRIVYYFNRVAKSMDYLIDEIREEDMTNEVFVMTTKNELPELEDYAQIIFPQSIRAYEKRGEPTDLIQVPVKPIKADVVIYTSASYEVGGIETFTYNFCKQLSKHYKIVVLYDTMDYSRLTRLQGIVECKKNKKSTPVMCDTIIMNRITDTLPSNIRYKQSVQMCHCMKQRAEWNIPNNRDYVVNVSEASRDSFKCKDGIVIHNLTDTEKPDKCLTIISAFRANASDKGGNEERSAKLCRMLKRAGIKFLWIYFSNQRMSNEPDGMIYGGCVTDVRPYLTKADYVALLSDTEAYPYILLEALELNVPVIVTPLEINDEMEIYDGENGYIIPFDMADFDVEKLLTIPKFERKANNGVMVRQWKKILSSPKVKEDYKDNGKVEIKVIVEYRDIQLNRLMLIGETDYMDMERANYLQQLGYVEIQK